MKRVIAGIFFVSLAGCAHSKNCDTAEQIGATWIGATVDEVAANSTWGYPAREETVLGRKIVTWHFGYTGVHDDWNCDRSFGIGPNGKIQNAQWSGACDLHFGKWARPGIICQ